MSFTVQKSLGNSLFRFAVGRRRELRSIDAENDLSTGSSGEFIRHRQEIFYSADIRAIRSPEIPKPRSIASEPFWTSLIDGTTRGWLFLGMMIVGALFILLGLGVLANGNRGAAMIEIVIGLILIAIPIVIAAQKRRVVRQREERARREREERDARNAELLSAYTTSLERLRENPDDATLAHVERENQKLDMPYAIWADTAIGTVLYVGFSTLARVGHERAAEVARLMDRASDAAGLIAEDATGVKLALYSTILWHFLADDRLGETQLQIVRNVQKGFGITSDMVPIDTAAEEQFNRLRGVDHRNAPRCDSTVPLGPNEWCMYTAPIHIGGGEATRNLIVTNKRIVVDGDKRVDVAVPKIDEILVDADANLVTVRASDLKRALSFSAAEPIYLAAMVDLSTRLDTRPKSFM